MDNFEHTWPAPDSEAVLSVGDWPFQAGNLASPAFQQTALPELATLPDTTLTEPVSPDLVSPVFI